jgi:2,5-diamino-6-(ribosylamino)-4(3H)-pyrimidinone 5'-phosphate reductase
MNRPYVIINCAMSADGKISLPTKKQLKISSDEDIRRMYTLRNECDAILVGIGTILSDNPKLTVKENYVEHPNQPLRIILDTKCKTPENALAVNSKSKSLIITAIQCEKKYGKNVELLKINTDSNRLIDLDSLLKNLYNRGIKKLMVEGGSTVIWNFLKKKLVDEIYVYISPIVIGGKNTPTMAGGEGIKEINELIKLVIVDIKRLGPGILIHYRLIK